MTEKHVLVRAVCNRPQRPHTLATVTETSEGREVVYSAAVAVSVDPVTMMRTYERNWERQPVTDSIERLLYCSACGKLFSLSRESLVDALDRRIPRLVLEPEGFRKNPLRVLAKRAEGARTQS